MKTYQTFVQNEILSDYLPEDCIKLLIDGIIIFNKACISEEISFVLKYAKKKGIKITAINVKNNFPLLLHDTKATDSDAKIVIDTVSIINQIYPQIMDNRKVIVGDKGYIINETIKEQIKEETNIEIVAARKNMSKQNDVREKIILEKRYKIENFFANFKRDVEICFIQCRTRQTFVSFAYLKCRLLLKL